MKTRPYFTRKNLIVIALAFFYGFIMLFTGLCIESTHNIVNAKNPINMIAKALNFKEITAGVYGFVTLILVAVYVVVFVAAFIYEMRFAIVNKKKIFGFKMICIYLVTLLACGVLSIGLGLLITAQVTDYLETAKNIMIFIGQSMILALLIYILLFVIVAAIVMLVTNFLLVDKPFKFFKKSNEVPPFEEDDLIDSDADVAASFEGQNANISGNINASAGGTSSMVAGGVAPVAGEGVNGEISKVEQLDDREKVFPSLSTIDESYNGYAIDHLESDNLDLEELCVRFRNYLAKEEKLYFDLDTIRIFISGLAASHFMILEGLSGTGKSSLPRYFAKFANARVLFVPVQATWRDKTNILGYFNDFSKIYSETDFLCTLYESNYNPDQLFFFVLDEMNISRVEYYFADFLSVLEFPKDEWQLRVMQLPYNFIPPAKLDNGNIKILDNAYFIGTANKDDSTFSIADKVYDRAITIDFDNRNVPFEVDGESGRISLSKSKLHELYENALSIKENCMNSEDYRKFKAVTDFIYEEFDVTFGNRILTQIEVLVPTFIACGGQKEDMLDFILSRKVLAKLEGRFEDYVKNSLKRLQTLINKTYGVNVFKRSEKEINSLIRKL